ncbi:MAG TPA: hypothetical protein VLG12_00765 [Candidatus Saccharimonadales bacterium]|nr:hypothetical protein [Candidatus Saccharimonadales bacterium]
MDNSAQPTTNGQQSAVSDQVSSISTQQPEPVARPTPNRGGIPITPLKPVSKEPVLQADPSGNSLSGINQVDSTVSTQTQPVPPIPASQANDQNVSAQSQQAPVISVNQVNDQAVSDQVSISPPISSPKSKEHEPSLTPAPDVVKMTPSEIIKEEKVVEKEIEMLVEKSPDTEKPKIPQVVKNAGVEHAKADIPMPAIQNGKSALPMSYEEAEFTRKKYKWKDSLAWLSDLIVYHWKKLRTKSSNE